MIVIEGKTGMLISVHLPFVWYKPWRYLSFAIRFFTKSKWGHSAGLISIWGEWCAIEMNPTPQIPTWDKWCKDKVIRVSRYKGYYDEKRWAITMMSKQNDSETKYDYFSLFIWQLIYQLTGYWLGRTKNADKKLYCSEYQAWGYHQVTGLFSNFYKTAPSVLAENKNFETIYEGPASQVKFI